MPRKAVAAIFAGAAVISFSAILFKASGAEALTGGLFRMLYALPVLGILAWRTRGLDHRPRSDRLLAIGAGAMLGADVVAWQTAIGHVGAGLSTLMANSQVVIVPFVTWLILKERPSRPAILSMPLVLGGMALITGLGRADTYGPRPVLGVAYGALAAVLYSGFLIGFRRSNRDQAPQAGPLFESVFGGLAFIGIAGAVTGSIDWTPQFPMHGWLLLLALGPQVVGWLLIAYGLPRLPAATSSFAIVLQPTMTLIWAAIFFSESPSPVQVTGAALVLVAITTATVGGGRLQQQEILESSAKPLPGRPQSGF